MPIGYLDVPTGVDPGRRRDLVQAMYKSMSEAYPFPDDTRIFVREWPADAVSQDGLLESEPARPVFTVHVPQGAAAAAKRTMATKLNAAIAAAYPLPDIAIFIVEHPLDLVAVNGGILADNQQRVDDQAAVYS